ncbi:restriction endonuclease subunit S [Staphylococcus hominis]|uniref:restriction endonuclease subunit S n=1 Tax=Staphylococcus hominis TaxID=1290 RepID=UPI002005AF42|nr:restriction endonuclease subunit S [Staphylococcus hominis]MCK6225207.1 restriction endonuclease subunit S [Staphylococcus hominis]
MEYKISDLCDIRRGASPRPIKNYIVDSYDNSLPWVKIADATKDSSRYIYDTKERVSLEGSKKSVEVLPGDLILSNSATPGLPKFMKVKACIHDGWLLLRNFKNVRKEFLYYILLLNRQKLLQLSNGSVFNNLKTDIVKNYIVDIPSIKKQDKILKIIGNIEDKLDTNNKLIANLEELSQTLFKRWFVDFEFPDKDGNPYKSSGGEMIDSELGKIPLNWSIKSIDEVADCQNGYAFYKTGYSDSGYFVMDLGNINTNSQYVTTNKDKYINKKDIDQKKEKFLLKTNDLVMIMTDRTQAMNILGRTVRITIPDYFVLNQRMFRIRVYDKYLLTYLQSLLNSEYTRQKFLSKSLGSAQKYINTKHITKHEIILPNDVLLKKYYSSCENIILQSIELNEENSKLTLLRDTLLPKLMSGELEIPDDVEVNTDELSI